MYTRLMLAVIGAVLAGSIALAGDTDNSAKEQKSCTGSNYEMRVCLISLLERRDKELKSTFDDLVFRLRSIEAFFSNSDVVAIPDPKAVLELRQVQKLWGQFLGAECDWESSLHGSGSIAPLVSLGCRIGLIEARNRQLGYLRDGYKNQGDGEDLDRR